MKILETRRLILRHQVLSDLDSLFALYCDLDVIKYIPDAPRNYDETRAELEWHMNGHPKHPELGLWATILKETGKFIGRCGLLPGTIDGQDEVEVAFLISKSYWGQGLGTEAAQAILDYGFEKLHLPRLICLIDKDNSASIKVAEKIGMVFEKEGKDEMGPFLLYSRNNHLT
jgi:RimJ/RimL family protein N-acetyltransferase